MVESDIVDVKFSLSIPSGKILEKLSHSFPHLRFSMLSMVLINPKKGNCLLQVQGIGIRKFFEVFSIEMGSVPYSILFQDDSLFLVNFVMKDPWYLEIITQNHLNIRFPLNISKGKIMMEFVTERTRIDELFIAFDAKEAQYSIKKIGKYQPVAVLTRNQEEMLLDAVNMGYFEIPRRISLSNLAKRHKISPSALSETIRRITMNLANYYLS